MTGFLSDMLTIAAAFNLYTAMQWTAVIVVLALVVTLFIKRS